MISIDNRLYLSKPLLNEMAGNSSVQELTENKATKIFAIKNKLYVVVGSCGSETNGIHWVYLCECVPFHLYKEKYYTYSEKIDLITKGFIERGYAGQLFTFKKEPYVITGNQITVYPIQQAEQLDLFL